MHELCQIEIKDGNTLWFSTPGSAPVVDSPDDVTVTVQPGVCWSQVEIFVKGKVFFTFSVLGSIYTSDDVHLYYREVKFHA